MLAQAQAVIQKRIQEKVHRFLFQAEKYAPALTSRAWGLLNDPLAELMGLRVSKLNDFQVEIAFKNTELSLGRFAQAAETAVKMIWARHLLGATEKSTLTQCTFELFQAENPQHFVARTELLENDRERVLREARTGQNQASTSQTVLIFDQSEHLAAQVQIEVKITSHILAISGGD